MIGTETVSTVEAARIVGISRIAIWYAIQDGRLKAERVGRDWRIERPEVERFKQEREARSETSSV